MIIIVFGQLEHQAVGNYIWHCICMQLSFNIQIYSASIVGGMQNASSSQLETSRASSAPVKKKGSLAKQKKYCKLIGVYYSHQKPFY